MLLLTVFALLILSGLLFLLLSRGCSSDTGITSNPPPPPPSTYKVPDNFGEAELPGALSVRLMGTPANGVPPSGPTAAPSAVIWVNGSNEVLVHLDSTQVRILDGMLLVSVDLETDQTGRTPLICSFALSNSADAAGLLAPPTNIRVAMVCWHRVGDSNCNKQSGRAYFLWPTITRMNARSLHVGWLR